jgi:hypothetical protein
LPKAAEAAAAVERLLPRVHATGPVSKASSIKIWRRWWRTTPSVSLWPARLLVRIKDGQIRKVEALMVSLPYGQKNPYVPQQ